jgi:Lrp/AsnC family transcriptional regulator for asnA, asnC and gidA
MHRTCISLSDMKRRPALDDRMMQLLEQNARQSSTALAKDLGVSSATVRRRLKRLLDSGTLDIVAFRDPTKTGFPVLALIALNIEQGHLDTLMKQLSDRKEIVWACSVTGRFDVMALAVFRSNEELASFLEKEQHGLQGIKDSETFVCLHQCKRRWIP